MSRLQVSVFAVLLSLLLVGLSSSSAIRESASSRTKRQSADVKVAEYLAWIALGGRINPQGCTVAGCEVVDIEASSRTKRQAADVKVSELMAQIAMGNSCRLPACGLVDPTTSGKKKRNFQYTSVSDEERYNLLKALIQRAAEKNFS
ncbi:hypothetical protein BsWGS_19180 [Bradybaena similaris]